MLLPFFLVSSCSVYNWNVDKKNAVVAREALKISKEITTVDINGKHLEIQRTVNNNQVQLVNNTNNRFSVSYQNSYMRFGKTTVRVTSQSKEAVSADWIQPDLLLPPHSTTLAKFFPVKNISSAGDYTSINIAFLDENKKLYNADILNLKELGYTENAGKPNYQNFSTKIPIEHRIACIATIVFYGGYCWYLKFKEPTESEFKTAIQKALELIDPVNKQYSEEDINLLHISTTK